MVFQHNYPYQIWEDFAGPGIDGWREVVQTRRVQAILCGHTHYWQVANDGRNVAVATRSIGDPEGGPPGYAVAYLRGEDFAVAYRPAEDRGPLVLVTHPARRAAVHRPGPRRPRGGRGAGAGLVGRAGGCGGGGRIDGAALVPAGPGRATASGPARCPRRLPKGEHRLEVRAERRGRGDREQGIEFAVDPTGRFTAVPGVRPRVESTNFC